MYLSLQVKALVCDYGIKFVEHLGYVLLSKSENKK